mmetsp:Transcript_23092/g.66668  ORF Transcript_23092/g.66668 Transcript_23092/m.66668 type:complete len:240 (+) Transcript_23092:2201-2920(+)
MPRRRAAPTDRTIPAWRHRRAGTARTERGRSRWPDRSQTRGGCSRRPGRGDPGRDPRRHPRPPHPPASGGGDEGSESSCARPAFRRRHRRHCHCPRRHQRRHRSWSRAPAGWSADSSSYRTHPLRRPPQTTAVRELGTRSRWNSTRSSCASASAAPTYPTPTGWPCLLRPPGRSGPASRGRRCFGWTPPIPTGRGCAHYCYHCRCHCRCCSIGGSTPRPPIGSPAGGSGRCPPWSCGAP